MRRTTRAQLMRNAAVALGNSGNPEVVDTLASSLESNPYPLVRGHIAWALGQLDTDQSRDALSKALQHEDDSWVREEIDSALKGLM